MSGAQKLDAALDLLRRMPPTHIDTNLSNVIDIAPDLCENLLQACPTPP